MIELPGKDASFYSNASIIGNSIYITSHFKNKIIFTPVEYPALREFYERMIAKKRPNRLFSRRTSVVYDFDPGFNCDIPLKR